MNQKQSQSQGGQSQSQGAKKVGPGQQQQGAPEEGVQGDHLIEEDDGIPGSDEPDAERSRQQEQSETKRRQQDDQSRTGSDSERI